MAGIEKICEFSGEYPGWLMYGYKRNHIQICPKYRKLFRGAKAYIEINKIEPMIVFKSGGCTSYDSESIEFWDYYKHNYTVKNQYFFTLKVEDRTLYGNVNGEYYNWTFDLKDTVKRLKRMLRCRNLKVINKTVKENHASI